MLAPFWTGWKKEYLVNLPECHRMNKIARNVIVKGEVFLIHEDGGKERINNWKGWRCKRCFCLSHRKK